MSLQGGNSHEFSLFIFILRFDMKKFAEQTTKEILTKLPRVVIIKTN